MQQYGSFEMGSACLGVYGLTAIWRRSQKNYGPSILICSASTVDEGVLIPACDISISSVDGLIALRSAIDEALKYDPTKKADCSIDEALKGGE